MLDIFAEHSMEIILKKYQHIILTTWKRIYDWS